MTESTDKAADWTLAFLRKRVEKQWRELRTHIGNDACDRVEERLVAFPRDKTERNHALRGQLATKTVRDRELDRWEYEVTGGGRVRYLIDDDNRTILIEQVFFGHPSDTQ